MPNEFVDETAEEIDNLTPEERDEAIRYARDYLRAVLPYLSQGWVAFPNIIDIVDKGIREAYARRDYIETERLIVSVLQK